MPYRQAFAFGWAVLERVFWWSLVILAPVLVGHRQRVAVILSGMDSDGADALRTIKAAGGITFAQKLETAAHPDMPKSAIDTGFVDFELSPEEIAHELVRILS